MTDSISRGVLGTMTVREIRERFPVTRDLLAAFDFPEACWDCPVDAAARKQGFRAEEVVTALNLVVGGPAEEEEPSDREADAGEERFWSLV